ncbi:hypothetical protein [Campylobacter ureolyticus]|jgi:hypothetical protein|uniref:hypothetical protein n=1 Tax=Campylobacter ureolyticus TaxID=827 RepID=UPI0022B5DE65|nr:hypothetical protein [Campylobacter ureolyticus]MCZ6162927.1 hypothetical protein [Campylobacter ureolyticus]MCZ6164580.1 hypothetical protein [Campylobacter ureolyticus]
MSYKTFVNDFQILENGVYSEELIDELNRQGANIKENDDCYEFEIKEIDPIIKIVDDYFQQVIKNIFQEEANPYDLSSFCVIREKKKPLYERIESVIYFSAIFQSYNFVQYLYKNKLIKRNDDGIHTILKKIVISGG